MTPDLTIVVPAYNEAHRLPEGMDRFEAAVAEGAVDVDRTEVVLVDDGSTDGTAASARRLLAGLPHHQVVQHDANRGKGAAVRTGVAMATGACTAFMDADMAIDPRAVPLLLDRLRTADVAIGSRALADSMVETRYVVRSLMGRLFNLLVTTGTDLHLHDTQCGFKGFRTPVARLLFHLVPIDGFAFDVELLTRARRLGLRIAEVPVQWKHVAGSSLHPLHDSLRMLADVYRSRLGLLPTPPLPVVTVRDPAGPTDPATASLVGKVVAGTMPGVPVPTVAGRDGASVLLPLVDRAGADAVADALRAALPGLTVTSRMASADFVAALGPLAGRLEPPTLPE